MKKTALFITLVIELAICVAICISVNTDKYTLWTESATIVRDIQHPDFPSPAARANHPSHYYVFINYSGKSRSLLFVNYKPKLNINDEITVKYNPENINEVVYLPYEGNRVFKTRRNTILVFSGLIVFTTGAFFIRSSNKKIDDIIAEIESEYK